jgi:hypothetical protein
MPALTRRTFVTRMTLQGAVSALGVLGLLSGAGVAFADPATGAAGAAGADGGATTLPTSANVELMILHATNSRAPSIDPRVDDGRPAHPAENLPSSKLKNPPLSSYNTYAFKDRKSVLLAKGTPQHVALPNGRTVELSLVNVAFVRNEMRYTVAASISQPSGREYMKLIEFTASARQSVFVGGISFPTGSLVVAFTVVP